MERNGEERDRKMLNLKLQDKDTMLSDQEKSKDNWHHRIHTETKARMGRTYIRMKDNMWTKRCKSGNEGRVKNQGDHHASDGKTT